MNTFDELAAVRREWIADILIPWCRSASLKELRKAADEWLDIAGRVTPDATLWTWAWSRFPVLTVEDLPGINETWQVHVKLRDGREIIGYPDGQRSRQGYLVLLGHAGGGDEQLTREQGPFSIDDVSSVERWDG